MTKPTEKNNLHPTPKKNKDLASKEISGKELFDLICEFHINSKHPRKAEDGYKYIARKLICNTRLLNNKLREYFFPEKHFFIKIMKNEMNIDRFQQAYTSKFTKPFKIDCCHYKKYRNSFKHGYDLLIAGGDLKENFRLNGYRYKTFQDTHIKYFGFQSEYQILDISDAEFAEKLGTIYTMILPRKTDKVVNLFAKYFPTFDPEVGLVKLTKLQQNEIKEALGLEPDEEENASQPINLHATTIARITETSDTISANSEFERSHKRFKLGHPQDSDIAPSKRNLELAFDRRNPCTFQFQPIEIAKTSDTNLQPIDLRNILHNNRKKDNSNYFSGRMFTSTARQTPQDPAFGELSAPLQWDSLF